MKQFQARPVCLFILISYGLAWLVALPLWLGRGLNHSLFLPLSVLMMLTPALAALICEKLAYPDERLALGLGLRSWRPCGRTLKYAGLAFLFAVAVHLIALVAGSLVGVYHFDFKDFSAFDAALREKLVGHEEVLRELPPLWLLVVIQSLAIVPGALINLLPALGEELGWRAWLLPRLIPLGTFPAILISGVLWALWHAPLVLLGYNYPHASSFMALSCMTGMCICVGALLAWLRLRSGNVWPAALGHGAFNAAAGFYLLLGKVGETVNTTEATALGWTGWIFPAVLAGVLFNFFKIDHGQTQEL